MSNSIPKKHYQPHVIPLNLKGYQPEIARAWEVYLQTEEDNLRRMTFKGTLTPQERYNRDKFHDANNRLLHTLLHID